MLENEILEFAIIQVQVAFWKPHNEGSIAWGFFAMNDDLLVHLENLQMLWCIVHRLEKTSCNDLFQNKNLEEGFD